ncbi:MAG: PAS domain S-box protein [Rhodospirillaceae bacterium]
MGDFTMPGWGNSDFLASPPTALQIAVAKWVIIASAVVFAAIVPFAKTPLPEVVAFTPAYQAALVLSSAITATLLLSNVYASRSLKLFILACGYIFVAIIAVAHTLTFPGLFSPTGLLAAGEQTTAWLYMFWHAAFPIFVIAWARTAEAHVGRRAASIGLIALVASTAAVILAVTWAESALPRIMIGNVYGPAYHAVVAVVWGASVAGMWVLWQARPRTALALWLFVVLSVWVFDVALAAVFNAGRFDVGFYAGRIYGLIASTILLFLLIFEYTTFYGRLRSTQTELETVRDREVVLRRTDSEREQLLTTERAARERVINILESITDAFFAVDRNWRFTYVNREAERLLRRSRNELLGRNVWAEFPQAVGATFQREYERAMSEQQTVHFEEYYAPLGIWVDVRAFPAADGLSVYFRDVSRRKLAEQSLRESEERYRLLADMIPQHIWTTRPDGHHNYFSRRWYEYTGATPAQTQGEGWLALLHPEDRERTIARWQRSLRTGEPYSIEYRFRGADGKYSWFWGQAMPLRNDAGDIIRWFGTLTDITERKQAEEAMRESEERFRALANSIPQLAWMANPTGWIFWYNERWHEYTGTTLKQMEGWGWRKVHHPDHVDRVVERIQHAFDTGEQWEDTFPLRSRTGEYRWFLSRALPIKDASGKVVRWFGTNTDITEQIQAAAERERLLNQEQEARAEADRRRAELELVTESRARLIRGFTHDVRNPLGVADAQAWLLEDGKLLGPLSDKQRDGVQRIRRSIRTSLRLIDELMELARAEAGQIDIKCVEADVGQLAREVTEDFRAQATAAGLALDVRISDGLKAVTD